MPHIASPLFSSVPPGSDGPDEIEWSDERHPAENYSDLGLSLSRQGCYFRLASPSGGLIRVTRSSIRLPTYECLSSARLASEVVDKVRVRMVCKGRVTRGLIPAAHRATMLASEAFLQHFPFVDDVVASPRYRKDFSLTPVGYTDHREGERILCLGGSVASASTIDALTAFLDVMDFETEADRTNAVAAALTVLLRHRWPGAKPIIVVTATKSHAGKDAVLLFATDATKKASTSYGHQDWAVQCEFVRTMQAEPDLSVIVLENVRLENESSELSSAFIERLVMDANPVLSTSTSRRVNRSANSVVVGVSMNRWRFSSDFMNRALSIHLAPRGDVASRDLKRIGNPKEKYPPENKHRIEAELRGMIERWKEAGCPLATCVSHSFSDWAATIGAVLEVNGFKGFLANKEVRRATDDPVKKALGLLAGQRPDVWLRPGEWSQVAVEIGTIRDLLTRNESVGVGCRTRQIGPNHADRDRSGDERATRHGGVNSPSSSIGSTANAVGNGPPTSSDSWWRRASSRG